MPTLWVAMTFNILNPSMNWFALLKKQKATTANQQTNTCSVLPSEGLTWPIEELDEPKSRRWRACRTIREREGGWKAARFDTRHCWTGLSVLLSHTLKTGLMASRTLCREAATLVTEKNRRKTRTCKSCPCFALQGNTSLGLKCLLEQPFIPVPNSLLCSRCWWWGGSSAVWLTLS